MCLCQRYKIVHVQGDWKTFLKKTIVFLAKTIVFLALTQITAFRPKQKVILWRSSVAQHEAGIIFLSKVKTVRCLSKIHLMQKDAKPSNPILENYLGTPIPPKYNVVFVDLDVDEQDCLSKS